eukprot:scaffold34129_cov32-Tisochrysis_lutea.AAC.3
MDLRLPTTSRRRCSECRQPAGDHRVRSLPIGKGDSLARYPSPLMQARPLRHLHQMLGWRSTRKSCTAFEMKSRTTIHHNPELLRMSTQSCTRRCTGMMRLPSRPPCRRMRPLRPYIVIQACHRCHPLSLAREVNVAPPLPRT